MRLIERLTRGQVCRVFCLGQLCSPKLVEMVGLRDRHTGGGYDGVWIDLEHGSLSVADVEQATRAARAARLDTFVRVAPTDYTAVMRPLEAGAGGVMAAQIRNAAQAGRVVGWAKFHPLGERGINSAGVDAGYGSQTLVEYLREANRQTMVLIQIEHAEALEDVERIAAVPGVDGLFVGPADLSQSLGIPAEWDNPRFWVAVERVAKAAGAHRKPWGILPPGPEAARRCVRLGCRLLSTGMDVWAMWKGIGLELTEYEDLGEPPSAREV